MNCLLTISLGFDLSLLDRLAASMDYPVLHKAVVNNGRKGALDKWMEKHPSWTLLNDTGNHIGVAGAFNLAPLTWPKEPAYLLVNDDIYFNPGTLRRVCEISDEAINSRPIIFVKPNSFCAFIWTRLGVGKVGLFDENFWPAYYEDSDMRLRMKLAGLRPAEMRGGDSIAIHDKPPCGRNFNGTTVGTEVFSREYYRRKWNSYDHDNEPFGPGFKTPFNNLSLPLSHWTIEGKRREGIKPLWDTFMSFPDASIYT